MSLGVLVLTVDGRGKRLDRIVVGGPQIVKQLAVFFGVPLDLGHQVAL